MNFLKLTLWLSAIMISGCQTSTNNKTSIATNDRIEVSAQKADPEAAASKYLSLGMQYIQAGYLERAKDRLTKAEYYGPDMPDVMFGFAYYYQKVFEYEKADLYYKKALKRQPNNGDYLNAYGAFLCSAKKDYDGAIEYFEKAIKVSDYTSVGATYENAGFCALEDSSYTRAEEYFEKALTFNPNLINSLYGLAKVSFESGNYNKAESLLLKYEGYTKPTSESLLLGYKIGRRLNDSITMKSYGEKLMQLYPTSQEAEIYLRMK